MFERNILIVDDNPRIKEVYIPEYEAQIDKMKSKADKWKDYKFTVMHLPTMKKALEYLSDSKNCVDVLLVDYDFNGETTFTSGTAFVKYLREKINRYCQIVFYTMQGIKNIEKEELIELINSDVFKMIDKSEDIKGISSALFEAATQRNPIVESLERFYMNYASMLESYSYTIGGENVSFDEIINHIRLDDETGRIFIDKLLQKAILLETNI